jgi:hypothetical protein
VLILNAIEIRSVILLTNNACLLMNLYDRHIDDNRQNIYMKVDKKIKRPVMNETLRIWSKQQFQKQKWQHRSEEDCTDITTLS